MVMADAFSSGLSLHWNGDSQFQCKLRREPI